jgi:prepilin-type N-terminal cleavage/methylation domain-containing protein
MNNKDKYSISRKTDQGFSLPEVMVVVLIVGIVTTFSLMSIAKSQSTFQAMNGAETLKVYLEKAFSDAKRRHARGNDRAKIQVTSATTYQVTIDFNGDGIPEPRTISLPGKTTFVYNPSSPPVATIDWRGTVAEGNITFNLKSDQNQTLELELSGNGDTNIRTDLPTLPTVTASPTSADVSNSTVLVGNSASNLYPIPTPTPTPLPFCTTSQKPAVDDCRCQAGKIIKDDGKCS